MLVVAPQWLKVCLAPQPPHSAQGLKILTFSFSRPTLALEAEQTKQEGEDWFPVFQLPEQYGSATHKALSPLVCCPLVWDAFLTPIWVSLGPRSLPPSCFF